MALKSYRPKGTQDFVPPASEVKHIVEMKFRELASLYGYREIVTPTFEHTEVFLKSSGAASDIVTKEMYTFNDRAGRSLTLRPEGTPGVVRAVLENRISLPCRLFYIGPCFRYSKPQKGRYREFYQLGVEALGEASPLIDAETIQFGITFFEKIGITNCTVQVNSIGCRVCRPVYREKLVSFLQKEREHLCADCNERIQLNPLRVFDCKNPSCQKRLARAPLPKENLCPECANHFQVVIERIKEMGIPWENNPYLVRGLDYYNRTTFEFISPVLGAQNSIGGGGRYDYLFEDFGGNQVPAIGLAIGLERTMLALPTPAHRRRQMVVVIRASEKELKPAIELLNRLRDEGISAQIFYDAPRLRRQFALADSLNALLAIVVGEDELKEGVYSVKNLNTGEQVTLPQKELIPWLKKLLG
ncbi:MAG: histidine--tRNA ligase [candidate division WOR-3 bacterium]